MSGDGGVGDDPEIVLPIRAVRRGDRHLFTAVLLRPQFAGGLDLAISVGDRPKRCNAGCAVVVADVGTLIPCPTLTIRSSGRLMILLAQMQHVSVRLFACQRPGPRTMHIIDRRFSLLCY